MKNYLFAVRNFTKDGRPASKLYRRYTAKSLEEAVALLRAEFENASSMKAVLHVYEEIPTCDLPKFGCQYVH